LAQKYAKFAQKSWLDEFRSFYGNVKNGRAKRRSSLFDEISLMKFQKKVLTSGKIALLFSIKSGKFLFCPFPKKKCFLLDEKKIYLSY